MNLDNPGTNRFTNREEQMDNCHVGVEELLNGEMIVLSVNDEWHNLNSFRYGGEGLFKFLNVYNDQSLNADDMINIPYEYLYLLENEGRFRGCFAVEFKNCLYGCICLSWDQGKPTFNEKGLFKVCEIIGGGSFSKVVNLNTPASPLLKRNVNFQFEFNSQNHDFKRSINVILSVSDCILNQSKHKMTFDPNSTYKVGYVCLPLRVLWGGDLKVIFIFIYLHLHLYFLCIIFS